MRAVTHRWVCVFSVIAAISVSRAAAQAPVKDATPRQEPPYAVPVGTPMDLNAIAHGVGVPIKPEELRIVDPETGEVIENDETRRRRSQEIRERVQKRLQGYRSPRILADESQIIRIPYTARRRGHRDDLQTELSKRHQVTVEFGPPREDPRVKEFHIRGMLHPRDLDPGASPQAVAGTVLEQEAEALGLRLGDELIEVTLDPRSHERRYYAYLQGARVESAMLRVIVSGGAVTEIHALHWLEVTPELDAALGAPRVTEAAIIADMAKHVSPQLRQDRRLHQTPNDGLGEPEVIVGYYSAGVFEAPLVAYVVNLGGTDIVYDASTGVRAGSIKVSGYPTH